MTSADKTKRSLAQMIKSGTLPDETAARAQHYLDRLQTPLRIGILGRPGSGKSTVLNLLVGADVVPANRQVPTLQVAHGDSATMVCTLPDGQKTQIDGHDLTQITGMSPVYVELCLPLPALAKISVLDVVAPDDDAALLRASLWAAKRCDVVLWCSRNYDSTEQTIWAQMPDAIKDHGFLLLTHADVLRARDALKQGVAQAQAVAGDSFQQIIPLCATEAMSARGSDGAIDKNRLRDSGAMAVIAAIRKQATLGQQAVIDLADVLLAQQQSAPDLAVQTAPAASTKAAFQQAIDQITADGTMLLAVMRDGADDAPAQVMAQTAVRLHWLCELLHDSGDAADPALHRTRTLAYDAVDLVQLMQLEKRDAAVGDAISLLLQIKHELQTEIAA